MTEHPGIPPHGADWLADLAAVRAAVEAGECFFCAMGNLSRRHGKDAIA